MSVNKLISVFVLVCVLDCGLLKEIPDYISICKRDPETINDCARHSIEELRPILIKGITELDVPGIDPFYIEEISPLSGGVVNPIGATSKNIKITGAGNFTLKKLNVDLDSFTIKARIRFPRLHLEGEYKVDTKVLIIPISGEGTFIADSVKCDAEMILQGKIIERDGAEYINFTNLDLKINMKDYRIKLNGLFNGDSVLGEAANQAINQNRVEFLEVAKPHMEMTVSSILLKLANNVITDLSLDQILPKP